MCEGNKVGKSAFIRSMKAKIVLILFCLLVLGMSVAGCSKKGAVMPKHRKRTHCDCPYFSSVTEVEEVEVAEWR